MFKIRLFLYFYLISNINGDCTINQDLSDFTSQSAENYKIHMKKENRNRTVGKDIEIDDEENNMDEKESAEEGLNENKVKNNKRVCCNNSITTTKKSSFEEYENEIVDEDFKSKRIDSDFESTTGIAEFLNKTTTPRKDILFRSLRDRSSSKNSLLFESSRRWVENRKLKGIFSKSCRDKDNDDLCHNTLVEYPYAVSIQKRGSHYATGALLDKRWILTVAGEFYHIRESIKLFRARLGSVNSKRGGVLLPLQEVSIHPLYVPGKSGYDLGLLRLGEPVNYTDYIQPIRISPVNERVLSAKFMTNYWPRLIVKGELLPSNAPERTKSNSMRVSIQKLIDRRDCRKMMLDLNEPLRENSLCLRPLVTHHSLCMPDPGAPIAADDGLWGITSGWTSKMCHSLPGPTIFTRVSAPSVRTWIDSQLLGIIHKLN